MLRQQARALRLGAYGLHRAGLSAAGRRERIAPTRVILLSTRPSRTRPHRYEHLRNEAEDFGRAAVWCDVYDCNPDSTALHRGLGFEPVTTVYRRGIR